MSDDTSDSGADDAVWLDEMFAQPARDLALLPEWARTPTSDLTKEDGDL